MTELASGVDEHAERLRAAVLALRAPVAAKRAPAPVSSVFGRAAAAVPGDVHAPATTEVCAARWRGVETSALMPGTSLALLVLPTAGPPSAEVQRSMETLRTGGATIVALGPDMPRHVSPDRSSPLTLPLRVDDSLAEEWALIAAGPVRRIAFLARREPDGRWSWLVTRDPIAVHRAGTAILERVPFLKIRVPALSQT